MGQKQQLTSALGRLATRRVPVARVGPGQVGEKAVEFADGTRLDLDVRDGKVALGRLARRSPPQVAYLGHIEPCFGHWWYWLHFWGPGEENFMVLARVDRFQSAASVLWQPRGRWWSRHSGAMG